MSENIALLGANAKIKQQIKDILKQLKEVSSQMRENRNRYNVLKSQADSDKKVYKPLRGDLVDELFGDYINKLNCPVTINRLGNGYYTFGTRKIFAKVINGKLVIRVGGGYMGIEEFMRYYGQQELTRMQKFNEVAMPEEEDEWVGECELDIDKLKKRLRDRSASARKESPSRRQEPSDDEGEEESKPDFSPNRGGPGRRIGRHEEGTQGVHGRN